MHKNNMAGVQGTSQTRRKFKVRKTIVKNNKIDDDKYSGPPVVIRPIITQPSVLRMVNKNSPCPPTRQSVTRILILQKRRSKKNNSKSRKCKYMEDYSLQYKKNAKRDHSLALPTVPSRSTMYKMAAEYLKDLKKSKIRISENVKNPLFLTDQEEKRSVLDDTDIFMFIVSCGTGKILHTCDSVEGILHCSKREWMSSNLYSLTHPDDVAKVKEQLSITELPHHKVINTKDISRGCFRTENDSVFGKNGLRPDTGFICRMKVGCLHRPMKDKSYGLDRMEQKENFLKPVSKDGDQYAIVHCSGSFVHLSPTDMQENYWGKSDNNVSNENDKKPLYFKAFGRLQKWRIPSFNELSGIYSQYVYTTRQALDCRATFVDQKVVSILGYQPSDLLGHIWYDFVHPEDQSLTKNVIDELLKGKIIVRPPIYRFRTKDGDWVQLQTIANSLENQVNNEIEFMIFNNRLVKSLQQSEGRQKGPIGRRHSDSQQSFRRSYKNPLQGLQQTGSQDRSYENPTSSIISSSNDPVSRLDDAVAPVCTTEHQRQANAESYECDSTNQLSLRLLPTDIDLSTVPYSEKTIPNNPNIGSWQMQQDIQDTQPHHTDHNNSLLKNQTAKPRIVSNVPVPSNYMDILNLIKILSD